MHVCRCRPPAEFLEPLLARVRSSVEVVAEAARSGVLRVDDDLHLSPLPADDDDPEVTKLRAKLDHRIGEVQFPEVILSMHRFVSAGSCSGANRTRPTNC
jgi:hypothetical protein